MIRGVDRTKWSWHEYGMRVGFWRLYDALPGIRSAGTTVLSMSWSLN